MRPSMPDGRAAIADRRSRPRRGVRHARLALAAAAFLAAACEPAGDGNILEIEAFNFIEGAVFVDANASGDLDGVDLPARSFPVALVVAGTSDTIAETTTSAGGVFRFNAVPVGTYAVVPADDALGDTMRVVFRDPPGEPVDDIEDDDETLVTLGIVDSTVVRLGIAFPVVPLAEARTLPAGRKVFVRAVAQSAFGAVAAGDLYVQADSMAIRITRVTGDSVSAGDSLLVFGALGTRDGQPAILDGRVMFESSDADIDTLRLVAAEASSAGGGDYDGMLARVEQLTVTDTAHVGSHFVITAEDPSGTVEVSFASTGGSYGYAPDAEIDVTGILVPKSGVNELWQVRVRSASDLVVR